MKTVVELSHTQSSQVVIQNLCEDYENVAKSIHLLMSKDLKPYQVADLAYDLDLRDAIKFLLSYYMTEDEYLQFMEIQRCYGNA